MGKTASDKIRLGIFVVLGTVFLVVAAYLIGNNQDLFSKTFTISTIFNNVNGLQLGNNVRFSGINVGTVKGIDMENDSTIRVRMAIEQRMQTHITKDAIASIGSDGLVGNMIVNIIPGRESSKRIQEGDEIPSYSKIGTDDMMSTLNVTNQNAALLTADLLKVTQSLTQGKGTLGRLLNDSVMANDLQVTITNLKHASGQATLVIGELNEIIRSTHFNESPVGVLLNDTISGGKIKNIISNLETSSREVDEMVKNLNTVVNDFKKGDGAIHYLTSDTTLVQSLEISMKNIEEGTARFNENMEALKHNFLTRRYFKKQKKNEKRAKQDQEDER
ncbi:MAG: MlaD family protein [Saonia sp.]